MIALHRHTPFCIYVALSPLLCYGSAKISVAHAEPLAGKTAAVGNFVRRRRGSGSARVSPTLHGWRRGSCCILHRHHFLPNQSGILIKMDWGFYGCRNWTQVVAFLAKPSAVCVWFKRCPLIGCGPELVRSMPAPTQRQLLADGFMKQRCIIIIRALLLMPSLNGCFAVRGYLFSKFDWFQSVSWVWERRWSGVLLPTWLPHDNNICRHLCHLRPEMQLNSVFSAKWS